MDILSTSLVDWSRAQFALTAMYHWLFVPLTLGLGIIMSIMESVYVVKKDEKWKKIAKFWMMLFGINFAVGVATGLILEFEFGTNWSNYSWFVGDIFGAPLAIEGIVAFFLEATFISIMYFGWDKVSKRFHLASTWLTVFGATISAYWILVANGWMQNPTGMTFNPDTVRNEMNDFWAVAFNPLSVNKFFHTVLSGWVVGGLFVVGVSAYLMLRAKRLANTEETQDFARKSMWIGAIFGLVATILVCLTGDTSSENVAKYQPMKLAAMEGLYEGKAGAELIGFGIVNPSKQSYNDSVKPVICKVAFPKMLSWLSFGSMDAYVPGIRNIIDGGYTTPDGGTAVSFEDKVAHGKEANEALKNYRIAKKNGDIQEMAKQRAIMDAHFKYFGYSYLENPEQTIPNVPLTFYSFHLMVALGGLFIIVFAVVLWMLYRKKMKPSKWLYLLVFCIPLGYIAGQAGWIVAEVGRQPWTIQDLLPVQAAVSKLDVSSVQTTFWIFASLFTILLAAELTIMVKQIKKGF
ncbi:MAG: cytochrome ubiquinol oxidase subunit I [Bacteroidales bacterium]|jgi:cytochrome d ubiquinol oxidase subunit I|nr:cytochrome ubiquinol oxidase subunit I [Bacteroidales bacterium]